jgi:hypothetical protein
VAETFQHTVAGKAVTLTKTMLICRADIEVSNERRVVRIEFRFEGDTRSRRLWFTPTGTAPSRLLSGSRVEVELELCFENVPDKAPKFHYVVLEGAVIPLCTSRKAALARR